MEEIDQLHFGPDSKVVKNDQRHRQTTDGPTNLLLTPMDMVICIDSNSTINKHSRVLGI